MLGVGILLAAVTLCFEMYRTSPNGRRMWQEVIKSVPLVFAKTTGQQSESTLVTIIQSSKGRQKLFTIEESNTPTAPYRNAFAPE